MALTQEEKEILGRLNTQDFYGPLLALVLFRYEKRDKPMFRHHLMSAIPTLIDDAYTDLESDD